MGFKKSEFNISPSTRKGYKYNIVQKVLDEENKMYLQAEMPDGNRAEVVVDEKRYMDWATSRDLQWSTYEVVGLWACELLADKSKQHLWVPGVVSHMGK